MNSVDLRGADQVCGGRAAETIDFLDSWEILGNSRKFSGNSRKFSVGEHQMCEGSFGWAPERATCIRGTSDSSSRAASV